MKLADSIRDLVARLSLFHEARGKYLLLVLALSLLVRLVPAYFVYGSFDVGGWKMVVRELEQGHNPYETGKLNWPPLWPALLYYTMRLEEAYSLPTHFSVKIIPCVADSIIAAVLFTAFVRRTAAPAAAFRRSLWYALNPVAIATCALQGQFESLPCLFALLALLAAYRAKSDRLPAGSAIWLGLGGMAKTWPLALIPALLPGVRSFRHRVLYLLIVLAPTVVSVAILYLISPRAIAVNVIGYHSSPGNWGLTAFNYLLSPRAARARSRAVLCALYAAWLITYAATWRRDSAGQKALLGILTFYVFTPGWGPQYLVWILPIAVLCDLPRARIYTVVASVSLAIFYTFSPFNGEYFNFVLRFHSRHFWATYLAEPLFRGQSLLFLPLWLVCIAWWVVLLRELVWQRSREPGDPLYFADIQS